MPRPIHVLTLLLCLTAVLPAQGPIVYSGAGALDSYIAKDPSASFVSADAGGLTFRTSKGMVRLTGPNLVYQDQQGKWQPSKPQIASDNAGGWKQNGAPVEVSLTGGGPAKRLKVGKGSNAWEVTLEGAAHKKDNEFSFTGGGQTWRLHVLPNGSEFETTISSKQGAKTYAFSHHPGNAAVTIDKAGNLVVGTIKTTRALMLGANRRIYSCGPWTADKTSASFTCDDKDLPPDAVPYIIDPTTTIEVAASSLDCEGTLGYYSQWWVMNGDPIYACKLSFQQFYDWAPKNFTASFAAALPANATVTSAWFQSPGDWTNDACTVNFTSSLPATPGPASQFQTATRTVNAHLGNEENGNPSYCYHIAGVPTLVIDYIQPVAITVSSTPSGRSLSVDGAGCTAPCVYQWVPGSTHTISAATQSGGAGVQYVFDNWSGIAGGAQTVTTPNWTYGYSANFTTQYQLTASAGAGGSISPGTSWYNAGAVVSVSAAPGGGYQFSSFSGALTGSATPQNVTMNAAKSVSAAFTLAPVTITVTSSPAGRSLTVDGAGCTTPCTYQWVPGSAHTIAAATQSGGAGLQYAFGSWSDGGGASHAVTGPASATTYTANFTTQYQLTTSAGTGGTISPATGWYNAGAVVSVSATPSAGYQFSGFSGALAGTTTPQNLAMNAAASVTAGFSLVPVTITLASSPTGRSLTVDGAGCTTPCSFSWTPGAVHTITAATQAGTGVQYVFASWSDGGAASHSVTTPSSATTYTANFTTVPNAPGAVTLSTPANGATNQSRTPTLSWSASSGATSYDVYLGSGTPTLAANVAGTTFTPGTALAAATTHSWYVIAKNAGGNAPASATWTFTTMPNAPGAVTLSAPGNGAANQSRTPTLSWIASSGATAYDVYLGSGTPTLAGTVTTGTTFTPATLAAATTHSWYVIAKNAGGSAPASATWTFTTVPNPPGAVTLSAPANGATSQPRQPALTWSAVSGATAYDVYLGSGTPSLAGTITSGTTFTPGTALAGSTTHSWYVIAKNAGGSAPASPTWTFTTLPAPPPAVTLLTPANASTNQPVATTLTWNLAAGATTYDVYVGVGTPTLAQNVPGGSFSPAGLSVGNTYSWYVIAKNAGGSAPASPTWTFTVPNPPAAVTLSAPANGATDQSRTPTLSWSSVAGPVAYDVYLGSGTPTLAGMVTSGTTFTPGTALAAATTHSWYVIARNAGGSAAASATRTFTTVPNPPATVTQTSPSNGAANQALLPTLTWGIPAGATTYDVYLGTSNPPTTPAPVSTASYTPSANLAAGTTYYWNVVAKNAGGSAPASATWTFTTLPPLPPGVTLTSPMDGAVDRSSTLTLTWSAVAGATYDLYLGPGTPVLVQPDLTGTSYTPAPPLNASTTYFWRVVAKNASGSGPSSATWSFTTSPPPPPAVTLTGPVNGTTNQSVTPTLTWALAPGATTYDVLLGVGTPTVVTNVTAPNYTPSQPLSAQTTYQWTIVAKNSGGAGPMTGAFSFTTGTPPATVSLTSPTNGAGDQPTLPVLRWASSPGATQYEVYLGPGTGAPTTLAATVAGPATSYGVTSALTPSSTYSWRVVARNAAGSAASSPTWTFGTAGAAPATPALTAPAYGSSNAPLNTALTWTPSAGATWYDVYCGTSSNPPYVDRVTSASFTPTLTGYAMYYWRIVAGNGGGSASTTATWSFTTILPSATLLSPANLSTGLPRSPTLTWGAVSGATSYDVYLNGQATSVSGTSYSPSTPLAEQTSYEWYVVARNGAGSALASLHWTFTTISGTAANPAAAFTREYIRMGGRVIAIENPGSALSGLTSNKPNVSPGETATLTATLNSPAPVGGATVQISSSATTVIASPAAIVIPAGLSSGTTTITGGSPASATDVTFTASYAGGTAGVIVRALPALPTVNSVIIGPPATLTSGSLGSVTVTLTSPAPPGGATITFAITPSADGGLFPVPSLVIDAGNLSGTKSNIMAGGVGAPKTLTVSASYNGSTQSASVMIVPLITLAAVSVQPPTVVVGTSATVTVTLSGNAPSAIAVTLSSSDPQRFPVTPLVVPQGASSQPASFTAGPNTGTATITATYLGVSLTATVTVVDTSPAVSSVYIAPPEVAPTSTATVSVALTKAAPAGGWPVSLTSSNPAVFAVPATMTVPAGQAIGTFTVTAQPVSVNTPVTVTASDAGSSKTGTVTITSISLSATSYWVSAGQSTYITVYPVQNVTWSPNAGGTVSPTGPSLATTYTAPLAITNYTYETITATAPNGATATIVIGLQPPIQDVSPNGGGTRPVGQPITYTWSGPDTVYPATAWTNPNEYLILIFNSYPAPLWYWDQGCNIQYKPATRTVYVGADGAFFESGALGSATTLGSANSKCFVNLAGSDWKNGIVQYVSMPITFKPPLSWQANYGPVTTTKWIYVTSYLNGTYQTTGMSPISLQ